jgi:hypothetical protein
MGERENPNFYARFLKLSLKTRGLMWATLECSWVQAIFRHETQCGLHGVAQTEGRKAWRGGRRGSQGAGCGTRRRARRRSRGARTRRERGAEREGESIPRRRGCLPADCGREFEGREGREEMPAHVTQLGTLTSRGGFEGRCPPTLHSLTLSRRGGFREEVESRKRLVKTGSHSVVFRGGSGNSSRKGASLWARGPRAGTSRQSRGRELRPPGDANSRFAGAQRLGKALT